MKLKVNVSILPQVYLLDKTGGERVEISLLVPPGKDPHSYSPTPGQIAKLVKSKILFLIGMPFEKALLPKIQNIAPKTAIIHTEQGIERLKIKSRHDRDDHEPTENHHGEGTADPHIWLDPSLVKLQTETILRALIQHDPAGESYYTKRAKQFISDLDQTHQSIKQLLSPLKGKTIYVFHPSFGYFTNAYQLIQEAIEIEGKRPKIKELALLIKKAKREKAKVIFVQPQFDKSAAQKIARAINGEVIPLNPLAQDILGNLEFMARSIKKAMIR